MKIELPCSHSLPRGHRGGRHVADIGILMHDIELKSWPRDLPQSHVSHGLKEARKGKLGSLSSQPLDTVSSATCMMHCQYHARRVIQESGIHASILWLIYNPRVTIAQQLCHRILL